MNLKNSNGFYYANDCIVFDPKFIFKYRAKKKNNYLYNQKNPLYCDRNFLRSRDSNNRTTRTNEKDYEDKININTSKHSVNLKIDKSQGNQNKSVRKVSPDYKPHLHEQHKIDSKERVEKNR